MPRINAVAPSTALAPCRANPGLIVPAGVGDDGLPSGLELDGRAGTDRQLLGLGLAIEQVLGPVPAPIAGT